MQAYAINLAGAHERRVHITAQLDKSRLSYEIVTGINGFDVDLRNPKIVEPSFLLQSGFQPGRVGCALSHLQVYQKVLERGLHRALVLEDDVTLPSDLDGLIETVADHLTGSEVVLLNYQSNSKGPCSMSLEGSVRLPPSRLLVMPLNVEQPRSTAAYIITREACKRMTDFILPVRVRADEWGIFYKYGVLDRVRCVVPLEVFKSPDFGTMIHHTQASIKGRILRTVTRHNVPLVHRAIARRRQRIFRQWNRTELLDKPFINKPSRLG